jgi:nitrite reductase/ring-hydroxylating ferredoxin subunit
MLFKPVITLTQLKKDNRHVASIDGHKILFIWHVNAIYAVQSQCPHLKLPLKKGTVTEDCTIICPFHKSEFNLTTGDAQCWSTWPPMVGPLLGKITKEKSLRIYPTQINADMIHVGIE